MGGPDHRCVFLEFDDQLGRCCQLQRMQRTVILFKRTQMRIRSDYVRLFVLALVLGLLAVATPVCGQSGRKVTKLADGVGEIQHEPRSFQSTKSETGS